MPTIVGILTFMSWINFILNSVEHEKSFITLGPGQKASHGNQWAESSCKPMKCHQFIDNMINLYTYF